MSRAVVLGVAALSVVACTRASPPPPAARTPLAFDVAGCARVLASGACVAGEGRALHVWVAGVGEGTLAVTSGAAPGAPVARVVHGGLAFAVTPASGARELR